MKLFLQIIVGALLLSGLGCESSGNKFLPDSDGSADGTIDGSDADADSDNDGDGDADADGDGGGDSDGDTDSDTDTDSDGDSDADTDGDSDSDADGGGDQCFTEGEERCEGYVQGGMHQICESLHWVDHACATPLECNVDTGTCDCPPASLTTLTGKIFTPKGETTGDPISRAFVYVPKPGVNVTPEPAGAHCTQCIDKNGLLAYNFSNVDGTFSVSFQSGLTDVDIVVQKGPFQRYVTGYHIANQCASNSVPTDSTRLPANPTEAGSKGRFPHIAVANGSHDKIETVIESIIGSLADVDQFDDPCGTTNPLFLDHVMINYDIVFIPCGQDACGNQPAWDRRAEFTWYLNHGGKLFVTDQAYDYLEQPFPERIFFKNDPGAGSTTPGAINAAEVGTVTTSMTIPAAISTYAPESQALADWLGNFSINPASVPITGWMGNWVVVEGFTYDEHGVPTDADYYSNGTTWTTADMSGHNGYASEPLTISFNVDPSIDPASPPVVENRSYCGRALFSSYHTREGGATGNLNEQERIMEFMILEIGVIFCPGLE